MPNVGSVLKAEITRLARREIRGELASLRKSSAQHRSAIAAVKRDIEQVRKKLRALGKSTHPAQTPEDSAVQRRFSATRLAAHRKKLGLSAQDYGALVGVTGQSVYKWEDGHRPRAAQLEALAGVRSLGKREAQNRLAQLKEQGAKESPRGNSRAKRSR